WAGESGAGESIKARVCANSASTAGGSGAHTCQKRLTSPRDERVRICSYTGCKASLAASGATSGVQLEAASLGGVMPRMLAFRIAALEPLPEIRIALFRFIAGPRPLDRAGRVRGAARRARRGL